MPEDSYAPVLLAASIGLVAYGLLFSLSWLAAVGIGGTAACAVAWLWPDEATAFGGLASTPFGMLPLGASGRRSVGWWGMMGVVATEASFFGYLLFSYFYLGSISTNPWPSQVPGVGLPLVNTGILLSSSVAVWWGERGAGSGDSRRLRIGIGLGLLLGAIFLSLQGVEYARETISGTRDAYGSLFYTITGFHAAHVLVGLVMLGVVLVRALLGHFREGRHEAVSNAALYWHFVDAVWLAVFTSLYVSPFVR
jgi:heme/copper-type cytochrome/quinol oxidase subunit 3